MTPSEFLSKVESIDVDLSAQVAIENTANQFIEEQQEQLTKGLKSDDSDMPEYVEGSKSRWAPGKIRLLDTGDWYRGMLVDVRQDIFIIQSGDVKNKWLQKKYGSRILGLGSVATGNYIRILEPEFLKQIKSYLQ